LQKGKRKDTIGLSKKTEEKRRRRKK